MRLVSYQSDGNWRAGAVIHGQVIDVEEALLSAGKHSLEREATVLQLVKQYGESLNEVSVAVEVHGRKLGTSKGAVDSLQLGAPIREPEKVLCVGLNYKDHVAETGRALPRYPDIFSKFSRSLIGPQDEIRGLAITDNLDFEGELAVVISQECRNVQQEDALDVVAGLMVLNDITARDLQYRGTQWLIGKSVDDSTPTGRDLVTLDEISDIQQLEISTRVNGVEMQHSNTRHMIFPVAEIITYLSRTITLAPGDIIATGTPEGIGAKRNPPVWLTAGDVVEVEVEQVGVLKNTVAAEG
ncbi:MAG: fumarylacetoacetate hydrolase family protein [Gulosibacter sp.]|uniref:fumarylacetoacetate hydrolase family protein n=1 Tax=Gulosibacter sp. TaxID=2817531 RepID=UPI003F8E151B